MLPTLLTNFHRIQDLTAEILESCGTFIIKGVWFTNSNFMMTSDPANVQHVTSTNFSMYPKGMGWKKRFDIFGNTIFNTDSDEWKNHKVPVDFATLLNGHIFYISCKIATGCDATSFLVSVHESRFSNATSNACEAILARHLLPETVWMLQKWLRIGKEGKLIDAWATIDNVLAEQVSVKREEMRRRMANEDIDFNSLELHLTQHKILGTVSVFDNHPVVENRIREEIQQYLLENGETKWLAYGAKELNEMVYLHAAICETLRLFPPIPFESRTLVQNDTLPSGHRINRGQNILICTYAMGRMTSVWGEDCYEFKPERWITHDGRIKHEPAHKFFAFNAGPRIGPGKDVGFTLMKATASAIIHNYHNRLSWTLTGKELASQPVAISQEI
ncbi:hypothetical protein REPUB_Repub16aG0004100 [Reevesia pubescens]